MTVLIPQKEESTENGKGDGYMQIFDYFFAVGCGIAAGLASIIFPSIWVYRRFLERGTSND